MLLVGPALASGDLAAQRIVCQSHGCRPNRQLAGSSANHILARRGCSPNRAPNRPMVFLNKMLGVEHDGARKPDSVAERRNPWDRLCFTDAALRTQHTKSTHASHRATLLRKRRPPSWVRPRFRAERKGSRRMLGDDPSGTVDGLVGRSWRLVYDTSRANIALGQLLHACTLRARFSAGLCCREANHKSSSVAQVRRWSIILPRSRAPSFGAAGPLATCTSTLFCNCPRRMRTW